MALSNETRDSLARLKGLTGKQIVAYYGDMDSIPVEVWMQLSPKQTAEVVKLYSDDSVEGRLARNATPAQRTVAAAGVPSLAQLRDERDQAPAFPEGQPSLNWSGEQLRAYIDHAEHVLRQGKVAPQNSGSTRRQTIRVTRKGA